MHEVKPATLNVPDEQAEKKKQQTQQEKRTETFHPENIKQILLFSLETIDEKFNNSLETKSRTFGIYTKYIPVQTLSAVALVPVAVLDLPDTQSVHELAPALLYLPATQSKTITENNNNNQINHKYYSIILSNTKLTRISLCTFFMDLNVNTLLCFGCLH